MDRCKRCGETFEPEDKFCGFCGFNIAAISTSELVTQQSLKSNDIQFNLALVYLKSGKYGHAIEIFEKLLERTPDDFQIRDLYETAIEALNEETKNEV
jgi:tetratricopeptide (TPR) repeat protein